MSLFTMLWLSHIHFHLTYLVFRFFSMSSALTQKRVWHFKMKFFKLSLLMHYVSILDSFAGKQNSFSTTFLNVPTSNFQLVMTLIVNNLFFKFLK